MKINKWTPSPNFFFFFHFCLFWYRCYYPHWSRDSVSPICGIFHLNKFIFQTKRPPCKQSWKHLIYSLRLSTHTQKSQRTLFRFLNDYTSLGPVFYPVGALSPQSPQSVPHQPTSTLGVACPECGQSCVLLRPCPPHCHCPQTAASPVSLYTGGS